MLQWEHSAILSTYINLPFSIKTLVMSIFKWLLKTGFTVHYYHTKDNPFPAFMYDHDTSSIKHPVDSIFINT